MRLITVVMGEESTEKRTTDTLAMMDYGFNMYKIDKIVKNGEPLGTVKVNLGKEEYVEIASKKDITTLNNSNKPKKDIKYEIQNNDINAPIKVGDTIGKILVYENGQFIYDVELTVTKDIAKANILKIFLRNIRDIICINI